MLSKNSLRKKILEALTDSGFKINPHLRPPGNSKQTLRRLHQKPRREQIFLHSKFLREAFDLAISYCRSGKDIFPQLIDLELKEVKPDSFEETIFRWWNLVWWSIPYQRSYGRQMRFLLWDKAHDSPFGLISLQSPILKMAVRDKALRIPNKKLHIWVNRSMNAQRVGALPPYNEILGGKMVALALTCNEIRNAYKLKYVNYTSLIQNKKLNPDILFITTTSAFGRSSIYNRLKYDGHLVAECLGYTQGSGSFHIPDNLYEDLILFLEKKGYDVSRGYGNGPSRKLKLISLGLKYLGLREYEYHGIKREFYLFPLVKNLRDVIQHKEKPVWVDRPFDKLVDYWKERWAIPRAERMSEWKDFTVKYFFRKVNKLLK